MTSRLLFVLQCVAFAVLAFVLAINWYVTLSPVWEPLGIAAAALGIGVGLFSLYMALDVATR